MLFTHPARYARVPTVAVLLTAAAILAGLTSAGEGAPVAPNDPYYASQWAAKRVRADHAWNATTGAAAVKVAVVDTGISPLAELQGQLGTGYNAIDGSTNTFDDFGSYGLGTQVAGIVGAVTNNGSGMAGLNWRVTMLPVKVCSYSGYCIAADIAEGINWAVSRDVDIINISIATFSLAPEVEAAVANALNRGVIVIASAGNSATRVGWPAAIPGVIAVGSTDGGNVVSTYSGRGAGLDLVAPGEGVTTLVSGGCCLERAGSPLAAAHVTGAAALLLAAGVPAGSVTPALTQSADDLGGAGWDTTYGHGLLDVCGALVAAGIVCGGEAPPAPCDDVTGDSASDLSDVLLVLSHYGESGSNLAWDIDGDRMIQLNDALTLLECQSAT